MTFKGTPAKGQIITLVALLIVVIAVGYFVLVPAASTGGMR